MIVWESAAARGYSSWLPRSRTNVFESSRSSKDHGRSLILRFVEENWGLGRIGDGSFDAKAGTLAHMFDFAGRPDWRKLLLSESPGQVIGQQGGGQRW